LNSSHVPKIYHLATSVKIPNFAVFFKSHPCCIVTEAFLPPTIIHPKATATQMKNRLENVLYTISRGKTALIGLAGNDLQGKTLAESPSMWTLMS
jgi:hypothetical protein